MPPPIAVDDSYNIPFGTPTYSVSAASGVMANDTNTSGYSAVWDISSGPPSGSLSLMGDGSFSYFPGHTGPYTDRFRYNLQSGVSISNYAWVTLNILASGGGILGAPSGSFNLFINGYDKGSGVTNLFIQGGGPSSGVSLFTWGNSSDSGVVNFYTVGGGPGSGISLFMPSYGQDSGITNLFVQGYSTSSGNFPCYINGVFTSNASLPLVLKCDDVPFQSGDCSLFVYGATSSGLYSFFPLFTYSDASGQTRTQELPLFIEGLSEWRPTSTNMNLVVTGESHNSNLSLDFVIWNEQSGVAGSTPLFIQGSGIGDGAFPAQQSMNMFLARNPADAINLFISGPGQPIYDNFPLSICGSYASSGVGPNLSIPNVVGNNLSTSTLFIRGF
jgi:hypothetical protein